MIRFLQTPGRLQKYLIGSLLFLVCVAMVWYLVPSGGTSGISYSFGGLRKGVLAQVDGTDITTDEVHQMAHRIAQQEAARYGSQAGTLMAFLQQQATLQAYQYLLDRQIEVAEAKRVGLHTSAQEIQDELQHGLVYGPELFPEGNFIGQTEYEQLLERNNLTPAVFEERVGEDILASKLRALVTGSASVGEAEIHQQFIKENSKVKFDYAVLKQDDIKKGLHPTEQELKAFYESHKNTYVNSIPEKRQVKYALVDTNKVEAGIQVTRDDLRAYYDQHREEYRVQEQVKVSHIWIKMPLPEADGKVNENKVAEAQRRADDLSKQLKNGAKFEDLAKKYSEDTASASAGGSLGWIKRDQIPELEKTVLLLAKGQISGVVKTTDGFHIIRLDDKQEAHVKTLDEVKGQIEPILRRQKGQLAAQRKAEELLKAAGAKGLDAAAAAQGIPVTTTDFFARRDQLPGLGPAPQFMDAVFTAAEKSPPDMAPASLGIVVFQLLAIKPVATPTFEEIRGHVEEEFKNERSSVLLSQKVQELSDRAKAEHDLKRVAKELGATMKTSDFVLPDGQVPDLGSMTGQAAVAFNMKPGEISGPINSSGNGIVIALLESQQPAEADFAAKRDQIRDSLLQAKQQDVFSLFVASLRGGMEKSGKIKINQEELKTLTRAGSEGM
jgi:peptidyl-prolyl cis-trans isomerase D